MQDGIGWCGGLLTDPQTRFVMARVGLHEQVLRCIPTFITYLALLMHTYHLAQVGFSSAAALGGASDQ
eukprot:1144660-Pelagomonas_calceolata.AAC.10